jgi:cysteine desulfurase
MSDPRIYLDWNATAPLREEARAATVAALDITGNPSSPHGEGRRARALIESAREEVAACLGADPRNVYFTSGATEAANWLLTPHVTRSNGRGPLQALLVGATEHACVLQGHRFAPERVERIRVGDDGLLDVRSLETRLGELTAQHGVGSVMVAVQAANNETGVIQPVERIAALVKAAGGIFICDAVQSVGRLALDVRSLADGAIFLSAHKLGGPKGVGAVAFTSDDLQPEPLIRGGGQERRQRSGTENVAGIAGLAAALVAAISEREGAARHVERLQLRFEHGLRQIRPDAAIFGENAARLPNTTCFALPGVAAETALIALDLEGVAVSSGSACSSGKVARSHVLDAMQVEPAVAVGALRISTGRLTSEADIDACLAALQRIDRRCAERNLERSSVDHRKVA